jgi:hypothetical protein
LKSPAAPASEGQQGADSLKLKRQQQQALDALCAADETSWSLMVTEVGPGRRETRSTYDFAPFMEELTQLDVDEDMLCDLVSDPSRVGGLFTKPSFEAYEFGDWRATLLGDGELLIENRIPVDGLTGRSEGPDVLRRVASRGAVTLMGFDAGDDHGWGLLDVIAPSVTLAGDVYSDRLYVGPKGVNSSSTLYIAVGAVLRVRSLSVRGALYNRGFIKLIGQGDVLVRQLENLGRLFCPESARVNAGGRCHNAGVFTADGTLDVWAGVIQQASVAGYVEDRLLSMTAGKSLTLHAIESLSLTQGRVEANSVLFESGGCFVNSAEVFGPTRLFVIAKGAINIGSLTSRFFRIVTKYGSSFVNEGILSVGYCSVCADTFDQRAQLQAGELVCRGSGSGTPSTVTNSGLMKVGLLCLESVRNFTNDSPLSDDEKSLLVARPASGVRAERVACSIYTDIKNNGFMYAGEWLTTLPELNNTGLFEVERGLTVCKLTQSGTLVANVLDLDGQSENTGQMRVGNIVHQELLKQVDQGPIEVEVEAVEDVEDV